MVELVAALALAPWAQPLRFQPLQGWQTGASGTFNSSYGTVPNTASPKESTAWMARGVRYRDRRTADPPQATLAQLPRQGIVVFAVVYQSAQNTEEQIDLRIDRARRFPCCDGTYVAGGEFGLRRGTSSRIFGDRACLLRLASNPLNTSPGTTRPRPSRTAAPSVSRNDDVRLRECAEMSLERGRRHARLLQCSRKCLLSLTS